MGFVARSAFWLGLVYSAMPFDSGSPITLAPTGTAISPGAGSSLANLANAAIVTSRPNQEDWKSAVEAARCALLAQLLSPSARRIDRCAGPERPGGAAAPALAGEIRPTGRCSTADR